MVIANIRTCEIRVPIVAINLNVALGVLIFMRLLVGWLGIITHWILGVLGVLLASGLATGSKGAGNSELSEHVGYDIRLYLSNDYICMERNQLNLLEN